MLGDQTENDPKSQVGRRVAGVALAMLGAAILVGFVAVRIAIEHAPAKDWPVQLLGEVLVHVVGAIGVATLLVGITNIVARDITTAHRWTIPLFRKVCWMGAVLVAVSILVMLIYYIWPALVF